MKWHSSAKVLRKGLRTNDFWLPRQSFESFKRTGVDNEENEYSVPLSAPGAEFVFCNELSAMYVIGQGDEAVRSFRSLMKLSYPS